LASILIKKEAIMSRILLFILLLSLIHSAPLIAKEKLFLEIGPRYSVSIGSNPLTEYWGDGLGVGGSLGYFFEENLALVGGISYRSYWYSGGAPGLAIAWGEAWPNNYVHLYGIPGPFGERSSIFETGLNIRIYGAKHGFPAIKPFFSMGFGYQREYVGDIILFVQRYDYDNNRFILEPFEWQGENVSGGTTFIYFGVGSEVFYYRGLPLVVEVGGQFGLREGSSAYIPIKMNFMF
jgi:hypothetical protein